jgi:ABC-type transport system involved in multi-copper enzyme maturation permease subunit
MNDILTICRSTMGRMLQIKALYILLILAVIFIATASLYGDLSGGREKELMVDTGYAVMGLVGFLSALVVVFDLARDLRHKLVQTLLTKPLGRNHYLLGKFWGVFFFTVINVSLVSIGFGLVLWVSHIWVGWGIMKVLVLTLASMGMLIAVGILLSTFLGEVPSAIGMLLLFLLGNATHEIAAKGPVGRFLDGVLPNFDLLNLKLELGHFFAIDWFYVWGGLLYAILYTVFLLSIAIFIFRNRDINV